MRRLIALAAVLAGLLAVHADLAAAEAPAVDAFANSPGAVTVQWAHSGEGVYWFVIEEEQPYAYTTADIGKRAWTITGLQPGSTHRYRVCAVYDYSRDCSDYASVTTMSPPAPKPAPAPAPAPAPKKPITIKCLGRVRAHTYESIGLPGQFLASGSLAPAGTEAQFYTDRALGVRANGCGRTPGYVSFASKAHPGFYLRASGDQLVLARNDGSEQFKRDATFTKNWTCDKCPTMVDFGAAFRSGEFIVARGSQLKVEQADGSPEFTRASTFKEK